jgi:hypothetical protein
VNVTTEAEWPIVTVRIACPQKAAADGIAAPVTSFRVRAESPNITTPPKTTIAATLITAEPPR